MEAGTDLILWAPKSLRMVNAAMKLRSLLLGRKAMTKLDSILKSRDITLPTKVHIVKTMVFSSSHVQVWQLDQKRRLSAEELMILNCSTGEDS